MRANGLVVEKREKLSERSFGIADGRPHQFYREIAEEAGSKIWIYVPKGGESTKDVWREPKPGLMYKAHWCLKLFILIGTSIAGAVR